MLTTSSLTVHSVLTSEAWVMFLELGTILNVTFPLASRCGTKVNKFKFVGIYFFFLSERYKLPFTKTSENRGKGVIY